MFSTLYLIICSFCNILAACISRHGMDTTGSEYYSCSAEGVADEEDGSLRMMSDFKV